MQKNTKQAKPLSEIYRPELTRLPRLSEERLLYRKKVARRCRWFIQNFTKTQFFGLENVPDEGPALIVSNHLGAADMVVALAGLRTQPDGLGKIELFNLPLVGKWLDRYGIIWVHRGKPDRRALRSALAALEEGRFVGLAPEGRQTTTGALEEGTEGAAYLALKSSVPLIPTAFTGTEDANVYGSFIRLRKPEMTYTVGTPFSVTSTGNLKADLGTTTDLIMRKIAALLPKRYRGFYA